MKKEHLKTAAEKRGYKYMNLYYVLFLNYQYAKIKASDFNEAIIKAEKRKKCNGIRKIELISTTIVY